MMDSVNYSCNAIDPLGYHLTHPLDHNRLSGLGMGGPRLTSTPARSLGSFYGGGSPEAYATLQPLPPIGTVSDKFYNSAGGEVGSYGGGFAGSSENLDMESIYGNGFRHEKMNGGMQSHMFGEGAAEGGGGGGGGEGGGGGGCRMSSYGIGSHSYGMSIMSNGYTSGQQSITSPVYTPRDCNSVVALDNTATSPHKLDTKQQFAPTQQSSPSSYEPYSPRGALLSTPHGGDPRLLNSSFQQSPIISKSYHSGSGQIFGEVPFQRRAQNHHAESFEDRLTSQSNLSMTSPSNIRGASTPLTFRQHNPYYQHHHQGNQHDMEEINTKDLAHKVSTELKRYSIPQAVFAQRVLCRSQGTLSDLLRNPKPWSKLKSGRETFRRMWKWLQEPEFQRMSALRLAELSKVEY